VVDCACDHGVLPRESSPIKYHIQVLFIEFSLIVGIFGKDLPGKLDEFTSAF
jgi:hypothetical protein